MFEIIFFYLKKFRIKIVEQFSRLICVLNILVFYDSYLCTLIATHFGRVADRLNRLKCGITSPPCVDRAAFRLLTWSRIYYYCQTKAGVR